MVPDIERPQIETLPDVLTPYDLMAVLPIGRNGVYDLLNSRRIPNVRVGQKFLVSKQALKDFLRGDLTAASPGPLS